MMRQRLEKKEQIILFLNRRGYAGFVSCRKCGEAMKCPHCTISLTAHMHHAKPDRLECHYCGYTRQMPSLCPVCHSPYLGTFGIGTQKVEEMVRKAFPKARVLRMDADTTAGKEGHEKILREFSKGQGDILVGTQMIVKGHDFPNVTLVGILAADLSLNVGDFRAAERTYQLLAQAAGRAGRGEKSGDVVLQTYQPEHYSIVCAAKSDYRGFYEQELAQRQMLQYPPVSNILGVLVLSPKEECAAALSNVLAEQMKQFQNVVILGPAPASLAKARDIHRYVIYAKCLEYPILRQIKNGLEAYMEQQTEYKECRLQFNFNS
jgi:primosomal protein N' (replication factor Y)